MGTGRLSSAALAAALGMGAAVQGATPYGFTVHVTLSPRAAARLAATRTPLEVVAYYDGDPAPGQDRHADDTTGQIEMGTEHVRLPASGNAVVTGSAVKAERLKWVKPGTLAMYVNVNTVTMAGIPLTCLPLPAGTMKAVAGRTFNVTCKISGE